MTEIPKMSYKLKDDKYVVVKNGVYFALTKDHLQEMKAIIQDIENGEFKLMKRDSRC